MTVLSLDARCEATASRKWKRQLAADWPPCPGMPPHLAEERMALAETTTAPRRAVSSTHREGCRPKTAHPRA